MTAITYKPGGINVSAIAVILVVISAVYISQPVDFTNPEDIRLWATKDNNMLLAVCVSILFMILCAMTPMPAEVIAVANGMIFGPLMGSVITWISAMLGAWFTFRLSRCCADSLPHYRLEQGKREKIKQYVDKWGTLGFLVARLIPTIPFFALNIGAAFLPLSTRKYLLITGISILPHVILFNLFGELIA